MAYLNPAKSRPNLKVEVRAFTHRVQSAGTRAVGIEAGPIGLSVKTGPELNSPDVQCQFLAGGAEKTGEPMHRFPGCTMVAIPCRPESRGWLLSQSPDPTGDAVELPVRRIGHADGGLGQHQRNGHDDSGEGSGHDPGEGVSVERTFAGKVALVTGASKNIGRTIALDLAARGASLVINGRSDRTAVDGVVAEINASGGQAIGCLADVSDQAATEEMVKAAVAAFGGIDVLVSNAGLRRQTPFLEMSLSEWREVLSVALDGAFILARAAVPFMVDRGGGAIVALSGISTHVGTPNRCHVSASKAGLEGLMRALAVELAPRQITCNAVAPGAVDTVRGTSAGVLPSTLSDRGIPLGRKAAVGEISAAVRFLAGPEGRYITGQTVHVNGGVFLT